MGSQSVMQCVCCSLICFLVQNFWTGLIINLYTSTYNEKIISKVNRYKYLSEMQQQSQHKLNVSREQSISNCNNSNKKQKTYVH